MGQMTTLQQIEACEDLVDRLVDATGRNKCKIICVLGDMLKLIRDDVLILEEASKNAEIKMEANSEEKGE